MAPASLLCAVLCCAATGQLSAGVEDNGSLTRVAAFPIGIDPDRFTSALETPEVKANIAQLLNRCAALLRQQRDSDMVQGRWLRQR